MAKIVAEARRPARLVNPLPKRAPKDVMAFALNNEGHPFYTDYVQAGRAGILAMRFSNAVMKLKKLLPGGTWTFTIDGQEQ